MYVLNKLLNNTIPSSDHNVLCQQDKSQEQNCLHNVALLLEGIVWNEFKPDF